MLAVQGFGGDGGGDEMGEVKVSGQQRPLSDDLFECLIQGVTLGSGWLRLY